VARLLKLRMGPWSELPLEWRRDRRLPARSSSRYGDLPPKPSPQEPGFFAAAALLNFLAQAAENLLRSRLLLMQACISEPACLPHNLLASFLQSCDTELPPQRGLITAPGGNDTGKGQKYRCRKFSHPTATLRQPLCLGLSIGRLDIHRLPRRYVLLGPRHFRPCARQPSGSYA
jgi:hypothetical protein